MEIAGPGQVPMTAGAGGNFVVAMQKLNAVSGVAIQQKRQLAEALIGFVEQNNKYVVYNNAGEKGPDTEMFFVQEGSAWWERMCVPPDCKPWRMDFRDLPPGGLERGLGDKFLHIERPCTLTCCCLNRPELEVTELPSNRLIGKLRDPWHCWNVNFQLFDSVGQHQLSSSACCCQKGILCPWPCCGCTVDFQVTEPDQSDEIAHIQKTWMMGDYCPLCFQDWDNFQVAFGKAASPDYKVLLMSLAIFIQLRYFDSRNQA